jgi:hypothetical protein
MRGAIPLGACGWAYSCLHGEKVDRFAELR